MADKIDYEFIATLEGGACAQAYVPDKRPGARSGVTIATGFDLGQRSEHDLTALGLSKGLKLKFKPYLGLRGRQAYEYLTAQVPRLSITLPEAAEITRAVYKDTLKKLSTGYSSSSRTSFFDLPSEAQTVIFSVAYQYGPALGAVKSARMPEFWKLVLNQEWKEAAKVLQDFKDAYKSRRNKEAGLLEKISR